MGICAFRVICVNLVPHFTTIARSRAEHEEAIKTVVVEVLKLCGRAGRAGLASLGQIAIDGTKIGSDAALDRNRDAAWIRAEIDKILSEATETDAAEDAEARLFDTLVDEPFRHRQDRLARLQAALAEAEAEKTEAGRRLRGRKPKDPHAALERAKADLAAAKVQADRRPRCADLEAKVREATERLEEAERLAVQAPREQIVVNLTDPESRIMKTQQGWVQGYNVQAAVNAGQVVISHAVTKDHNDVGQLVAMIEATRRTATKAGIEEPIGLVLADAGYWSEDNATAKGADRLIATTKDWKQRKEARETGETAGPPPEDATAVEAMEHRLRTLDGAEKYGTRSCTVEPVFGDTKENRGVRRFMRRGLTAAESETALIFAVHNLLKVFHHEPSAVFSATCQARRRLSSADVSSLAVELPSATRAHPFRQARCGRLSKDRLGPRPRTADSCTIRTISLQPARSA